MGFRVLSTTGAEKIAPVSSLTTVTTTGNIDDLDFSDASLLRMNNASLSTIRGLKAGTAGQRLTLVSIGAGDVALADQNTNSLAANRLITGSGATSTLFAGAGSVTLSYDATTARWRVVNQQYPLFGSVAFPATPVPVTDVNTLDTYAEGTWTPVDASGASLTFTFAAGTYLKIGKLVFINFQIVYPVTANGAAALIGGLPFTVTSAGNGALALGYTTGLAIVPGFYTNAGATTVTPDNPGIGAGTVLNSTLSGGNIIVGGAYLASV